VAGDVNAHLAGELAILEELHDGMIELVTPMDEESLNWRPAMPDANSIAVLVRHVIGSISAWCSRALGEPFERDRDAEFRSHDTATSLVEALEESRVTVRELFARLDPLDPGIERTVTRRQGTEEVPVTVGWCVAHAVGHAGEHWGQIQLNRDLYRART